MISADIVAIRQIVSASVWTPGVVVVGVLNLVFSYLKMRLSIILTGGEAHSSGRGVFVVVNDSATSPGTRSVSWFFRSFRRLEVLLRVCTAKETEDEGSEDKSQALLSASGCLGRVSFVTRH